MQREPRCSPILDEFHGVSFVEGFVVVNCCRSQVGNLFAFSWYAQIASEPGQFLQQPIKRTDPNSDRIARYLFAVLSLARVLHLCRDENDPVGIVPK